MGLIYQSTRDRYNQVSASQAILSGLASDGGLYTPIEMPKVNMDFEALQSATYQEVAKLVMSAFFDDFSDEELDHCIAAAYDDKFDTELIAPIVSLKDYHNLELFHGATIAFKDMALSILPHLLTTAAKKQGVKNKIVILTATSGDTGKAAMAGFADVPGTEIIVFYPKHGVSKIQELQMTTQKGQNTHVIAIEGNFDDAQTEVKRMFNDQELAAKLEKQGIQLSSANSMNIGRLIPQVVYYVYAYAQLVKKCSIQAGDKINITVPTGNFGNILAAFYAKKIGLPVNRLLCASNENNVLTDFFTNLHYNKKRPFKVTTSPSMDILVSSNLERLIFHLVGNDSERTKELMLKLSKDGEYQLQEILEEIFDIFRAGFASEEETKAEIKAIFESDDYVIDPHTAVASAVFKEYQKMSGDKTPTVIASTASPYKFPCVVVEAIKSEPIGDDFEAVDELEKLSQVSIPKAIKGLANSEILHKQLVETKDMQAAVENYLGV